MTTLINWFTGEQMTFETKRKAVEMARDGWSARSIAQKLGTTERTITKTIGHYGVAAYS